MFYRFCLRERARAVLLTAVVMLVAPLAVQGTATPATADAPDDSSSISVPGAADDGEGRSSRSSTDPVPPTEPAPATEPTTPAPTTVVPEEPTSPTTTPPTTEPPPDETGDEAGSDADPRVSTTTAADSETLTQTTVGSTTPSDPTSAAQSDDASTNTGPPRDDTEDQDDVGALAAPTLQIDKANSQGDDPVEPGDRFDWNIYMACTGIEEDCVNYTFTDVIPDSLEVIEGTLPPSTPTRTVDYDSATGELTISFSEMLDTPAGALGWTSGSNLSFDIGVQLPADTELLDGASIVNEAHVDADNAEPADSSSTVDVSVPRRVDPRVSKQWQGSSMVAGSGDASTIVLGVGNDVSTSAQIDSLRVTDLTADTFEHFDLHSVDITQWPAGADTAQLSVCTAPGSGCPPEVLKPGDPVTSSPLPLPTGVDADDVTGVAVTFTNSSGEVLPHDPDGGRVELNVVLRDSYRTSGDPLRPIDTIDVDNCATTSADDAVLGEVTSDEACSATQILPDTLVLVPSKSFFADTDGSWGHDAGEHAVIGENSPVTGSVDVVNDSPFPISELTIDDPGDADGAEFDKFDAELVRLRFPTGATNAQLTITYDDGSDETSEHSSDEVVQIADPPRQVTNVSVTYTGDNGEATIEAGSTAGLDVHGPLNALVDESDLHDGVTNCAAVSGDAGRGDGTGTFTGAACDTVDIETPNTDGSGIKTASQDTFPEDQPVSFTLTTTNTGNLPLIDPVVADPPTDAGGEPLEDGNPFEQLELLSASVTGAPQTSVEVFVPGTGWVGYDDATDAEMGEARGVRAMVDGELAPTQRLSLHLTVQRRAGIDDGIAIVNCYQLAAGGDYQPGEPWCAPELQTTPPAANASLDKHIDPSELPIRVAGVPPQWTNVELQARNTGNLSARSIQLTDEDPEFFDTVEVNGIGWVKAPAGADRVQFDALVGDEWIDGDPTPTGSPRFADGVDLADIEGFRVTFTSTSDANDGYVITPCPDEWDWDCTAVVNVEFTSRQWLRSDPDTRVEGTVDNTVTGTFTTKLDEPGEPRDMEPATDDLTFVEGTAVLDVDKGPSGPVSPGAPIPFDLKITNTGTNHVADLVVVDHLPAGLGLDISMEGPNGPFEIVDVEVPEGAAEPPLPEFEMTSDPDDPERIAVARWSFAEWDMAPSSTLTIRIQAQLEPGVAVGDVLQNVMAAGSDVAPDDLECTGTISTDGTYGDGTYCTAGAAVEARAGAAFNARKWIAGTPDLGWYNNATGDYVATGDAACPSLQHRDALYTSTPCIALVRPGEQHHHLLRLRNAGTEAAARMTIVDRLPAPGDTGVLVGDRGTEWDHRPTLAGPVTVDATGEGRIGYSASESLCLDDLDHREAGCADGDWSADSTGATAFQVDLEFDEPLAPGGSVNVDYVLDTPVYVTQSGSPTIAWNSFAHGETTQMASGAERILPPIEPIKVGVATMYGDLTVAKQIGENPANLPVSELEYIFEYTCESTPAGGEPTVVATGEVTATPGIPGEVTGIPAGARCAIVEIESHGGIPSATEDDPTIVNIEAHGTDGDTATAATVTNDFPIGELTIDKKVVGEVRDEFTSGPYTMLADCRYDGTSLDGFPAELTIAGDGEARLDAPVGAQCTVAEPGAGGATYVEFDPAGDDATALVTIPADGDRTGAVTVTNVFAPGALEIVKQVDGPGVPEHSAGPFAFEVDCSIGGQPSVFTTTATIEGSADGTVVRSEPIGGLPFGTSCTVTEVDSGGADFTPDPVTVTIEPSDGEDAPVVEAWFLNPFSAGTVSVTKSVDGSEANAEFLEELIYEIAVTCASETRPGGGEPEPTTWFDATLPVAAGETATAVDDNGNPVLLPAGARCWAAEPNTHGATDVTIEHDSFETGVEVVVDGDAGAQELTLQVTNTFDEGELVVSKEAINGPEGEHYRFSVECTAPDGRGGETATPIIDGESTFELAHGEARELTVVAGSTCAVTEIDVPDDATVSIVDSDESTPGGDADGVVTVADDGDGAATAQVAFTNTFDPPGSTTDPDDDDGVESEDGAGDPAAGSLPVTGGAFALFLLLGAALVLGGLLLRQRALARGDH